jgi:hypothetical protein
MVTFPKNKILIALFILVLLITIFLLVLFKIKSSTSDLSEGASKEREFLDIGVKKSTNLSEGVVFYFLNVVLAEDIATDGGTGDAIGSFYFLNDKAKNIITLRIKSSQKNFYIGNYESNFDQSSTWKMDTAENLGTLGKAGTQVELRGKFDIKSDSDMNLIKEIDSIFNKIEKSEGKQIKLPEGFIFDAFSIGFVQK